MNKCFLTATILLILSALNLNSSQAKEVSFEFSAEIVEFSDFYGLVGLQPGDVITGSYTFETETAPDTDPVGAIGLNYPGAITGLDIELGEVRIDGAELGQISIFESEILDGYNVDTSFSGPNICSREELPFDLFNFLQIGLTELAPSDLVTGLSLSQAPPNLSQFEGVKIVAIQGDICNPVYAGSFSLLAEVISITGDEPSSPEELLELLAELVFEINTSAGISNALDSKLDRVLAALDDKTENDDGAALNSLYAFCNHTQAQRGKNLTEEEADQLIDSANLVIASLEDSAQRCN